MSSLRGKIPPKVFVTIGGGLGDAYYRYLIEDSHWGYIQNIKARYPGIHIKAMVNSPNLQSTELVRTNPFIDELVTLPVSSGSEAFFANAGKHELLSRGTCHKHARRIQPEVYLTEEDKQQLQGILSFKSKYIVLHPFAGNSCSRHPVYFHKTPETGLTRQALASEDHIPIIDGLIEKGYHVIVLGERHFFKKANRLPTLSAEPTEELSYERDGLTNLISKTNSRVAAHLVFGASGFIGTYSCFLALAWWKKIRTVCLAVDRWKGFMESFDRWKHALHEPQNRTIFLPVTEIYGKPEHPEIERGVRQTLGWFK